MTVSDIQHAIEELPGDQQAELAAWLAERDQARWEAEMQSDFAPGGTGLALLEEMKADARDGKFLPIERGTLGDR
jgi:hypothetical protein